MPYRVVVALTRQGRTPAMTVLGFFRKDPRREAIETLYGRIAAASREPGLYLDLGVPDTESSVTPEMLDPELRTGSS